MLKRFLIVFTILLLIPISKADYESENVPMNISIFEIVEEIPGAGGPPYRMRLYDLKIECNDIVFFNTFLKCKVIIENKGNIWEDILLSFSVFSPANQTVKIVEESLLVEPGEKSVREFTVLIPLYLLEGKYLASVVLSIPDQTLATSKESFWVLSLPDILTDLETVYLVTGIVAVIFGLGYYSHIREEESKKRPYRKRIRK